MHETLPYKSMVTGSYFGEQEIIERTKRKYTVRSERNCDLLTLTKSIFSTVIGEEYDEVYQEMRALAEQRKEKFHQAKVRMRKYLLSHREKLVDDGHMTENDINRYMETSESGEEDSEEAESGSSSGDDSESDSDAKPGDVAKQWVDNAKVPGPKREQQSGEVVET